VQNSFPRKSPMKLTNFYQKTKRKLIKVD
jgi:hypothetical protein